MANTMTGVTVPIVNLAIDGFSSEWKYVTSAKDELDSLAREAKVLQGLKEDTERKINRATREGMHIKNQVSNWVNSVETFLKDAADVQLKYDKRSILFKSCSPNLRLLRRTSKKCAKLLDQATKLKDTIITFQDVADKLTPQRHVKRQSVATVGMEPLLHQLKCLIENDEIGIIGIHGMSGIGKTTLLTRFHNEFLASSTHLDVIIWIEEGIINLGIDGMQTTIGKRLEIEWNDGSRSQEERKDILFKILGTMSFVLILDDLRKPLDLQCVGIPIPQSESKCKIILTTTTEELCDQMRAKKIKVETLQNDESWQLFQNMLGRDLSSYSPEIKSQAMKMVDLCCGLPQAIITVAKTMASKVNIHEWSHTYNLLKECPYEFPGMEKYVFDPLRLSYDNLPYNKLCENLQTICLFLNSYQISREILLDIWKCETEEAKNAAIYRLGILRASSMIETSDNEFSMISVHPLVCAMVSRIANENTGASLLRNQTPLLQSDDQNSVWSRWSFLSPSAQLIEKCAYLISSFCARPEHGLDFFSNRIIAWKSKYGFFKMYGLHSKNFVRLHTKPAKSLGLFF